MNLSFLPGDLHLSRNTEGFFVVTVAGQAILTTKSQRSALSKFNALRAELERKFPTRVPTPEEKAELLQQEINESLFGPNSRVRKKRKATTGGTRTFGGLTDLGHARTGDTGRQTSGDVDASPMRPEVGTQSEFKRKLPPKKYRYDDSLSPVLEWDGQNAAREQGEARIAKAEAELAEARKKLNGKPETKDAAAHVIAAQKAVHELKATSKPFLNWSGKAERLSFDVPTLPLFIHERLSTKAILETLKGHKRDKQTDMFDLFGDPQHSITDQVLRAYEHKDKWVNRMILGDSLVVMNSLLHYENLGGQVQMIFVDPPYGVKFGSTFQPFVRKRDVSHNDDGDMTREPEMVQAYRDTWELGLHSYLSYLRDRLLLSRELLAPTGSMFVQIGDANVHYVKALLDEMFGTDNFCGLIPFNPVQKDQCHIIGPSGFRK
jgi:adenine-specific DNA-methyltransferase